VTIPNPSSLKDLLADKALYDKLQKRMLDEAEDMCTCSRTKQMALSYRHVASGRYGKSVNAWNQVRLDSAQKRREMQRMNRTIRMVNLQKTNSRRADQT